MNNPTARLVAYIVGIVCFLAVGVYGLVTTGDSATLLMLAGILGVGTNAQAAAKVYR